ncbi:MAG: hypothetical protein C5B51_15760 [Terriglobia bacterium]|nr:MAG: hypothetical protein C5B51_15760 [Terriglobia bacterium]
MSSAVYSRTRRPYLVPVFLGLWAAAIAVSPDLQTRLWLALPALLVAVSLWTLEGRDRWLGGFLAAALLLPPLPIAWGDTGPHISLLLAAIGLFGGILWARDWHVPATSLNLALAALLIVLLASVAQAAIHSGAAVAAGSLVRVALLGISAYAFFFTAYGPGAASGSLSLVPWIYGAGVVSALFACVDFYFQFPAPAGFGPQFVWLESGVYRRAQGVFYDAGTLGNLCAFFLVMIAVVSAHSSRWKPVSRKALAMGGAVLFAALILSYSRSSLLNVLTALAVLAWLHRRRIRLVRAGAILISVAGGAALITAGMFPQFFEAYWQRVLGSAEFFFSNPAGVLSGRLAAWQTLTAWVAAHPWQALIGLGYKTLPYSDYLGSPVVGDNMYLTLLVETGVLGLGALVWLHVSLVRAAFRSSQAVDAKRSFFGAWMLCFWCGQIVQMFSVDLLTYWRVLPLYFWVLALALRP